MRNLRLTTLALAAVVLLFWGAPVEAYHDGGVAHCNGCHTMHYGPDNDSHDGGGPYAFLLTRAQPTDVCISCHSDHLGNTWPSDPLAPGASFGGGPFVFLTEDNLNDGHGGATDPILGNHAGHSVISNDQSVGADPDHSSAPGGTYSAANMHCTSCHDPHGKHTTAEGTHFRLLYGTSFPTSMAGGTPFNYTADWPRAQGIAIFFGNESNSNHTAYASGMSGWCGNCHGDYHTDGLAGLLHPTDRTLGGTIAANYNAYLGSGDFTGDGTAAYLAAVPVEDATVTTSYTGAVSATSKVMCLSCHRAHASSAPSAGRWDFSVTFLDEDGLESGSYPIPNPFAGTVGADQRSLCNKCHGQDPGV